MVALSTELVAAAIQAGFIVFRDGGWHFTPGGEWALAGACEAKFEPNPDLIDTALKGNKVRAVASLSLSEQDIENITTLTGSMESVRNHGVAIRRLIAREAKAIRAMQPKPPAIEGQTSLEDQGAS